MLLIQSWRKFFFGAASFLSPQVYTYLVENLQSQTNDAGFIIGSLSKVVPSNLPWISLYWVFAVTSLTQWS